MEVCRQQHPKLRLQYCSSALDAVTGADAVVLVTEWDEFRNLDLAEVARRAARPIFIDGRNFFSPEAASRAGLDYTGIGRAPVRKLPQLAGHARAALAGAPVSVA